MVHSVGVVHSVGRYTRGVQFEVLYKSTFTLPYHSVHYQL